MSSTTVPDQDGIWRTHQMPGPPPMPAVSFEPARTLFVAQSWPLGADPLVYFTSIPAAMVQANALAPTALNPVLIELYPGTWSDPVVWRSNVHLRSPTSRAAIITGDVTWTPGAGINAPDAAVREAVYWVATRLDGNLSVDASAKTGDHAVFDVRISDFAGNVTYVGRPGGQADSFQQWAGFLSIGQFTSTNFNAYYVSMTDALTFDGDTAIDADSTEVFGNINTFDLSRGRFASCELNNPIHLHGTGQIDFPGSKLKNGATLTVDAGGTADFRSGTFDSQAQLIGPGAIDRNTHVFPEQALAAGANTLTFPVPFPAGATFGVSSIQKSGEATQALALTSQSPTALVVDAGGLGGDFTVTATRTGA